jgi:two-component system, NtrC family, sensor kinase
LDAIAEHLVAQPDYQPEITIRTARVGDDRVSIAIRDNGAGIPESAQQRLFDPFFTTKDVGKGTGLGLSISYQIVVDRHCGKLECRSRLGEGTEFWIELPIGL